MKRLLLPLMSIALLAAFKPAPAPMITPPPSRIDGGPVIMSVLDRDTGEVQPQYRHDGQRWTAGERGHRYSVRLRNASPQRVLVVLSVDGINAISGEPAAPGQTGYVLDPWQSTDIAGWRKSNDEVAQFLFSSPADSYASRTGQGDNLGVIGIAVFNERRAVRWEHRPAKPMRRSAPIAEASPAADAAASRSSAEAASATAPSPAPMQRLGTGHGDRETSSVRDTAFERATEEPVQIVQLRYDSARNLRRRGIAVDSPTAPERTPQAFPQRFVPDPPSR